MCSGFKYFDTYKNRKIYMGIEKVINTEKKRNDLLKKASTISKKYKCDYCGDKIFNFISEVTLLIFSISDSKPITTKFENS